MIPHPIESLCCNGTTAIGLLLSILDGATTEANSNDADGDAVSSRWQVLKSISTKCVVSERVNDIMRLVFNSVLSVEHYRSDKYSKLTRQKSQMLA